MARSNDHYGAQRVGRDVLRHGALEEATDRAKPAAPDDDHVIPVVRCGAFDLGRRITGRAMEFRLVAERRQTLASLQELLGVDFLPTRSRSMSTSIARRMAHSHLLSGSSSLGDFVTAG